MMPSEQDHMDIVINDNMVERDVTQTIRIKIKMQHGITGFIWSGQCDLTLDGFEHFVGQLKQQVENLRVSATAVIAQDPVMAQTAKDLQLKYDETRVMLKMAKKMIWELDNCFKM